MGEKTGISWTDMTWNIARGCTKVDQDCKFCYMYRDSYDGTRYNPREIKRTKTVFDMPLKTKVTKSECWEGRPLVFTSSLTDVFLPEIDSYRHEMWDIIRKCPHLIFQILTKRPERIEMCLPPDWGDGWDNVWLGTSVGSLKGMDRIHHLAKVTAKTRFVSFEPLHDRIDLRPYFDVMLKIHWAIIGGESGHDTGIYRYRPCFVEWIHILIERCRETNTAVFVKQLGTYLSKREKLNDRHGADINEWPVGLRIREFPDVIGKIMQK